MEAATLSNKSRRAQPRSNRGLTKSSQSQWDAELIKAKIERKTIDIVLAVDLPIPNSKILHAVDDNDVISVKVLHVDTYSVKFDLGNRPVWISKAFIVAVYP